ncbi:MAG: TatD family hydrolase [Thermodesulfobacteriota bacterium]
MMVDQDQSYALIDTHAHLELEPLVSDPEGVVERAQSAGIKAIITVGIDLQDAKVALDIADRFSCVFGSVGFHPHSAKDVNDKSLWQMEQLARHPKVKAYGEIGLDFFRNHSPRDVQISVFREQLGLAKSLRKPVVIHFRAAYEMGLDMLEEAAPFPAGGVIHCFSGNREEARRTMELGFHISIPGPITYKKNAEFRDIVSELPDERILLETDCPFLAPEPLRGKDNEPAYMVHTARKVAETRGMSFAEIASLTTENAVRFFGLPEMAENEG